MFAVPGEGCGGLEEFQELGDTLMRTTTAREKGTSQGGDAAPPYQVVRMTVGEWQGRGFGLFQNHVANRLGVSIEELRVLRDGHLLEGLDWVRCGNRVLLSAEAVLKLEGVMGSPVVILDWGRLLPENSRGGAEARRGDGTNLGVGAATPYRVRIVKVCVNPRMVMGRLDDGQLVRVTVRSNVNFVAGLVLEAGLVHVQADLWRYEGRMPRRRGEMISRGPSVVPQGGTTEGRGGK